MKCPSCAAESHGNASICLQCGTSLTQHAGGGMPEAPHMSSAMQPVTWGADTHMPQGDAAFTHGYAGWWQRFRASLIDGIVLSFLVIVSTGAVAAVAFSTDASRWKQFFENPTGLDKLLEDGSFQLVPDSLLIVIGIFVLIALGGSILYYTALISGQKQSTWGQRAAGIFVVTYSGQRLSRVHAFGRWAAKLIYNIPNLNWLMYLATAITIGTTARKQALHDMMASTCVVRRSPAAGAAVTQAPAIAVPVSMSPEYPPPPPPPPEAPPTKAPHEM